MQITIKLFFVAIVVPFYLFIADIALAIEAKAVPPVQQADKLITDVDGQEIFSNDPVVNKIMQSLYGSANEKELRSAIDALQIMSDEGNAEAAVQLGEFLYFKSPWQDYNRAILLITMAVSKNHAGAMYTLASIYEDGTAVPIDMNKAITLYQAAARQGDVRGYTNMARLYFLGKGVQRDVDEGVAWSERGGTEGFAQAYSTLSQVYCCNLYGVPQNLEKSMYYRQKAAAMGDARAQWNVAQRLLEGNSVSQQTFFGLDMMEKLAAANNSDAMNSLGTTYARGRGVPIDKARAAQYWVQAVQLGSCRAMMNLAEAYDNGWGVALDPKKATEYVAKAVACNNPPNPVDLWKLGNRYHFAHGVEQDCNKAVSYYRRAAALGKTDALADAGYIYQEGCGTIKPDIKKAFSHYLQGAKIGSAVCQNNVGSLLNRGPENIARDRVRGVAWLLLANENINETAQDNLRMQSYTLSEEDAIKAYAYFKKLKKMLADITSQQLADDNFY